MRKLQFGLRLVLHMLVLTAAIFAVVGARMAERRAKLGIHRMDIEARITRDKMQQRIYRRDQEEHGRAAGFYDAHIAKLEQRISANQSELESLDR